MKLFHHIYHLLRGGKIIKEHTGRGKTNCDRDILERTIIPYVLAHFNPKIILDVGREEYEKFYNNFFTGRTLWTIDIDPKRRKFGSKNHITDNILNIKNHFENNYFDFILINGVCGWGLNKKEDMEKTFRSLYDILKPGGILIIGWNDFKDIEVIKPYNLEAMRKFKPYKLAPLKNNYFKCSTGEHTYNFYLK